MIADLEVPTPVHKERLKICSNCPLIDMLGDTINTARCGDCGCSVYVKRGLKDFTCPQGKW
jgi:hypothetical protein